MTSFFKGVILNMIDLHQTPGSGRSDRVEDFKERSGPSADHNGSEAAGSGSQLNQFT